MATRVDSRPDRSPDHADLGTAIVGYLADAEAGRVRASDAGAYSPAGLRSLRRTLEQVSAAVPAIGLVDLRALNAEELESLGWQVVDYAGLPPSRAPVIVDALRRLSTYAGTESAAEPSPSVRPISAGAEPPSRPWPTTAAAAPATGTPLRTPTQTMLVLGARVSAWIERIMVIALVLTAIGLAVALV